MVQPFRFGVIAEHFRSAIDWSNLARRAEEYGYDSFLVPHHIFHAPFTLLTAAAAATTSLTVGASVFNIDILRDPVFLATEAASLDQLSNGRLELGLGFGYVREEYRQVGIPFEPTDTRIRRFQEALQVVKAYYQSDDPLRFDGTYYKIDYQMEKIRPFQQPHPPIYIGGGGKRVLTIAAREADIVGIAPRNSPYGLDSSSITAEASAQKVAWVQQAAGERMAHIRLASPVFHISITNADPLTIAAQVGHYLGKRLFVPGQSVTPEQILDSPHFLIGAPERVCEILLDRRDRYGIANFTIVSEAMDSFAPIVAALKGK